MSRILVTGGRDFTDHRFVANALTQAKHAMGIDAIVVGDCPTGVDKFARDWANFHGVECHVFRADWEKHGKAAGPIRNGMMVAHGSATVMLAFPGGKGTDDCVRQARKAGVRVFVMPYGEDAAQAKRRGEGA